MKHIASYILILFLVLIAHSAMAQNPDETFQMKARVGYAIGGTAPLGIPAEIRSIDKFCVTPNFMVGFDCQYRLSARFGLLGGVRFEIKDMDTEVTTMGYHMKVKMDED